MNDPRVAALHYRVEHWSYVDYSKARPVNHEEDGFRVAVEEDRVRFEMKGDHPTLDSALEVVGPYISNWELDAALMSRPGEFKLRFVKSEIVDKNPTPGQHRVNADPIHWKFTTSIPTVTKSSQYPKPPTGVSLRHNDDVKHMLDRYDDLRNGKDKLPSVAQFCLTKLEELAGGRGNAAQRFVISKRVLNKVGELADKKGGPAMARKAKGTYDDLSPEEVRFLDRVTKVFIRRVAEEAHSPGGPFQRITVKDFPEVWP